MASKDINRTNVVFILSDDQGCWAMGCAGNKEINTPNLDKLAKEGIMFENFFCASPVCSPARASILTGKMPSQHGVHDFIKGGRPGNLIEYLDGQKSYTEVLAENGYVCALSGKWHLGNSRKPQKGFSHWYAHMKGMSSYYGAPMVKDGVKIEEPEYLTEAITKDAIKFIERSCTDDKPFYISINYTAPHAPWSADQHPKEYIDMYKDCKFESCPQEPLHEEAVYRYEGEVARNALIGYYASTTAMDKCIGDIIAKLEELNIRDNTLIIFTSDNGHNCGHHGIWGKGNGTLSLNMYDTSIKVPTIINHKGRIRENVVCNSLLSHYDIFPTLLDYLGIEYTSNEKLPGKSFARYLLNGEKVEHENVVIYDEYGPVRMVRNKEWKYVHRYETGKHELYNLIDDPNENNNVVDNPEYKDEINKCLKILEDWFNEYTTEVFDGKHLRVRGNGQLGKLGNPVECGEYFDQDRIVKTE